MRKVGWMAAALLLVAGAALADVPAGWSIGHDGNACEADYPQGDGAQAGGAMLTVAVMPPQHLLLLQHPAFPAEKQTRGVTLRFDDGAPITTEGMASDHIYGFGITPAIAMGLRIGKMLSVTVDGKDYVYHFDHGDAAMDEAARCAGTKTLPEVWSEIPKPIPGVPGWLVLESVGGTDKCSVRRNSPEVNTSLILSDKGRVILIAGRPDWAKWGGAITATLAIDDGPAIPVDSFGFQNLVMVPLDDDAVVKKLESAKALRWHLPWGDFRAEVDGLGAAETALRACDAKNAKR